MRYLIPILAAAMLAGCSGTTDLQSSNTDGVTIAYSEGYQSTAEDMASKECSKFGKRSKLRNVRDHSGQKWAIFDCVV